MLFCHAAGHLLSLISFRGRICAFRFLFLCEGPAWDLLMRSEEIESVTSQFKQNLSMSLASPQSGFMVCESLRTHTDLSCCSLSPVLRYSLTCPPTSAGLSASSSTSSPPPHLTILTPSQSLCLRRLRQYEENHYHTPVEHARFATSHLGAGRIWNWLNCLRCKMCAM